MSWRTVVVKNRCKLSYKNDYIIIRSDDGEKTLHASEVGVLIIENTAVSLTAYLLCELSKFKIKVVFCDHKRNPYGEITPYYGAHNASKKIKQQSQWPADRKALFWQKIVQQKITAQADVLEKETQAGAVVATLRQYVNDVQLGDVTNREAHAAKIYFKALFGEKFSRDSSSDINAALNYGYAILLSSFNREITASGYVTTIGVNHCNEYNPFNLTCDLMEPFRPLIDRQVYALRQFAFDDFFKSKLVEVLDHKVSFDSQQQYVSNAIGLYTQRFFRAFEDDDSTVLKDITLL